MMKNEQLRAFSFSGSTQEAGDLTRDQNSSIKTQNMNSVACKPYDLSELEGDSRSAIFQRFSDLSISNNDPTELETPDLEIDVNVSGIPSGSFTDEPIQSDECNLFVGDLARGLSEEEIQVAFSKYGRVMTVNIKRDRNTGKNLGYGFVRMGSHEEALDAKVNMQRVELRGRRLRVGWAQKNTALFVGSLPENVTLEQFKALFRKFGDLDEENTLILQSGRGGIVKFKYRLHAEEARRQLNGMQAFGSPSLRVDWNNTATNGISIVKGSVAKFGKEGLLPSGFCVHVILENSNGIILENVEDIIHNLFKDYLPLADVVLMKDEKRKDHMHPNYSKKSNIIKSSTEDCNSKSNADAGAGLKIDESIKGCNEFNEKNETANSDGGISHNEDVSVQRVHCSVRFAATQLGHTKALNSVAMLNGVITPNGDKVSCMPAKNDFKSIVNRGYGYVRHLHDGIPGIQLAPPQHFSGPMMWQHHANSPTVNAQERQRAPFDGVIHEDMYNTGKPMQHQNSRGNNWQSHNMYQRNQIPAFGPYQYNVPIPANNAIHYPEGIHNGDMPGYFQIPVNYLPVNQNENMIAMHHGPNIYHPGYGNIWYGSTYNQGQGGFVPPHRPKDPNFCPSHPPFLGHNSLSSNMEANEFMPDNNGQTENFPQN